MSTSSSSEPENQAHEPTEPASPTILIFPVHGKTKTWPFTQANLDRLSEAFPSLDVIAQAKKAREWCIANPSRQKTARGIEKFLFGWMERSQNRAGGTAPINGRHIDLDRDDGPKDHEKDWSPEARRAIDELYPLIPGEDTKVG